MTVSVCIPTYNQACYIEECIESVLRQSRLPDEIIVSNDCSTDNTTELLKKIKNKNPLIEIIYQPVNLGLTANSNACLKAAKGELIIRLSSDDILLPDYIKNLALLMQEYPEAGYAHCDVKTINKEGNITGHRCLYRNKVYEIPSQALRAALKGFKVSANILMYRKTALEKVGYLNSAFNFAEDFYLSTELSDAGFGNVYCSKVFALYRVWEDENNIRQKRKIEEINGLQMVFDKLLIPAFIKRNWSIKPVLRAKENFAITQASCLSWNVYSVTEKAMIYKSLLGLSSTFKARIFYNIYKSPFKSILNFYTTLHNYLRQSIKIFLLKVTGKKK